MIHKLLERQIRTISVDGTIDQAALLRLISKTYEEYEHQMRLQDHATQLMSDELNELNFALQRERDEKIAESQKRFELAVEGANDGLWDWNVSENQLWMSARCFTMLGLTPGTAQNHIDDWYNLIAPADLEKARAFIHHHLKQQNQNTVTLRFKHADGRHRNIMCRASAVRNSEGKVTRLVGIQTDISALEKAKEAAEAANAAKSDFLANMSHELRTPLNSVLGMTRLLLDSSLDNEQQQLAGTILRSSTMLLEIVNDILDISKIEAGEMRLETIGMDLQAVLSRITDALLPLASEKGVTVVLHYRNESFPYVVGDPVRLGSVLTNLIGNAIKYSNVEGQVDVYATCKPLPDSRVEFRCEVKDTGIGIPESKLKTIFEKFVQADTSTTRKYGGSGLGLTITKQLLELMGGEIGVTSTMGAGSRFWFTIPFTTTPALNEEKTRNRTAVIQGTLPPDKTRVLVAEDHPMNQLFISKLLQRFGIGQIDIVENGQAALKRLEEEPYDIILMDCHMPEKNGYDTTREIRAQEKGSSRHIPIIAMTANAMVGDKEKCLQCGMDEYVSKPISIDELKEALSQWVYFAAPVKETKPPASVPDAPRVDLSRLRTFSDGNKEIERELMHLFITESDKNLQILFKNNGQGDLHAWQEAGHMFKGGAASIGADILSKLCQEAQHFKGTPVEQIALFKKIESEYACVKTELKEIGLLD